MNVTTRERIEIALGIDSDQAEQLTAPAADGASSEERVTAILAVVETLQAKLKPGRLPIIAHRPLDAFGGQTLLEALAIDPMGTAALARQTFDWSGTA